MQLKQNASISNANKLEDVADMFVNTVMSEHPINDHYIYTQMETYVKDIPDYKRQQMLVGYRVGWWGFRSLDREIRRDLSIFLDDVSDLDTFTLEIIKKVITNPKVEIRRTDELLEGKDDEYIWFYNKECNMDKVLDYIRNRN